MKYKIENEALKYFSLFNDQKGNWNFMICPFNSKSDSACGQWCPHFEIVEGKLDNGKGFLKLICGSDTKLIYLESAE